MPAILKGWVDRVFSMGFAYGGGRWYNNGVFSGKRAIASITTGGPDSLYGEFGINGNLDAILDPLHHGVFAFAGFTALKPHITYAPARMSDDQRKEALHNWRNVIATIHERDHYSYHPLEHYGDDLSLKPEYRNS